MHELEAVMSENTLLNGKVTWYRHEPTEKNPHGQFGVILGENGLTYGFSLNLLRGFYAVGEEPQINYMVSSYAAPSAGADVKFIPNPLPTRRTGNRRVSVWGYAREFNEALEEINLRREGAEADRQHATAERLRCYPEFRVMEQKMSGNEPVKGALREFDRGTQDVLLRKYPLGRRNDPLLSSMFLPADHGNWYKRYFQRETAGGWQNMVDDPRTIELPKGDPRRKRTLNETRHILSHAVRYSLGREEGFRAWFLQIGSVQVGHGLIGPTDESCELVIESTIHFAETIFDGKDARSLIELSKEVNQISPDAAGQAMSHCIEWDNV